MPLQEFVEESSELLQGMEEVILEWDNRPGDRALVDALFRTVHTIKGGAGVVMRMDLSDYAHRLESLLDRVRSGQLVHSKELVSILLDAVDCLGMFLTSIDGAEKLDNSRIESSLTNIGLLDDQLSGDPVSRTEGATEGTTVVGPTPYLVNLKFDPEMPQKGGDPLLLLDELAQLGEWIPIVHPGALPDLEDFDPQRLYVWWSGKLTTSQPVSKIEEVTMFFRNGNDLSVIPFDLTPEQTDDAERAHQTQITRAVQWVDEDTDIARPDPDDGASSRPTDLGRPAAQDVPVLTASESSSSRSIRVSLDRLERLQNLIGEAVIHQSRLTQLCEEAHELDSVFGASLAEFFEENSRSVRDLQDEIQAVRMVPVDSIFSRLRRVVRDYSVESNKEIKLQIEGGDTELDKTVTDQLHGPLIHLIRNAMDHGIENETERRLAGKDTRGTIWLRAFHRGGHVIIEVQDDGKGMDIEKIRAKGLQLGLFEKGEDPSDHQLLQLVFQPGFTTTEAVTGISGRGVGMDTVKRDIEALLGSIDIFSWPGSGTRLRLRLPLTLAIIDGMIVRVGSSYFILPLLAVVEAFRPKAADVRQMKRDNQLVEIRGEFLPLVRLHEKLGIDGDFSDPTDAVVLVLQHVDSKHCLMVDEIIDQRPVVIKNMEDNFVQVPGMTGASIMGDGKVSFILDVAAIAA